MKEKTKKHLKIFSILSIVVGCVFGVSLSALDNNVIKVNAESTNETETNTIIDLTFNNDNQIEFLTKDIMLRADIDVLGIGNNFRYGYDFSNMPKMSLVTFIDALTSNTAYQYWVYKENSYRENFRIYWDGNYYDFSYIVSHGPNNHELRTFYFLTKKQYYTNSYNMVDFDGLSIDMSTLDMSSAIFDLYYYCDYMSNMPDNCYLTIDLYDDISDFAYYIPPYLTLDVNQTFNISHLNLYNMNDNIIYGAFKNNIEFAFGGDIFYILNNQGLNSDGTKYIVEVVGVNTSINLGQNVWSYIPYYTFEETLFYVKSLSYNALLFLQKYCIPSWVGEYSSEMFFNEKKLYKFGDIFHVFRGEHVQGDWTTIALPYLENYVYGTFENFSFEYGGKYYDNIYLRAPLSYSYLNDNQYEWYIRAGNQFIQYHDIIVTMKMIEGSFEETGEYVYKNGQALTYKGQYTEQIYNFMVLFGFVDKNIGPTIGITGTGGTFTDIFDIFGSAFNGVYNAFSVYVLPGVTLWALLMIPLVAIIIMFLVKLFKR